MRLSPDRYVCEWCAREFPRAHRRGRVPHYCGRTCRQRAYESRRRGAYVAGLPACPLPKLRTTPGRPWRNPRPAYEAGLRDTVRHALRPDGVPDCFGARPTLCGARAQALSAPFEPWRRILAGHRACATCRAVAERYPACVPLDVANDLSRARHVLGRLRAVVAHALPEHVVRSVVADALAVIEASLPPPGPRAAPVA